MKHTIPESLRTLLGLAGICWLSGTVGLAARGQASSAKAIPPKAAALFQSGQTLMKQGRLAEAQDQLVEAHTLAPESIPIATSLGKLDALLGKPQEAVTLFRSVEALDPDNTENELNLAIALATAGDLDAALRSATRAANSDKKSASAQHLRAKLLAALGRNAEARSGYEQAHVLAPTDTSILYDYAVFSEEQGDFRQEIRLLEALTRRAPSKAQYHFLLGRALERSGDPAPARKQLLEAVRLDPQNRSALYLLARSLQKDDPAQAATYNARFKALQASQEEMDAMRDRGNAAVSAMSRGAYGEAIPILKDTLERCAGCALEADLEKDLGLAQCQNGDVGNGLASLRRALALNPKDHETLSAIHAAEQAQTPDKN